MARVDTLFYMPGENSRSSPRRLLLRYFRLGILLILFIIVIGYILYQTVSSGRAVVVVESNPVAMVFVDGEQKGKTPLEYETRVGEIKLKLVPESNSAAPLSPFETLVGLGEGVKTIVRREFGESGVDASTQILSFDKTSRETSVAITTIPDSAEIYIDGDNIGVSPISKDVDPGNHKLEAVFYGFKKSELSIRTIRGYKTTVILEMAKLIGHVDKTNIVLGENDSVFGKIRILRTSLGFLRVRKEPSLAGIEVGRVEEDKVYEAVDESDDGKWYKIEFDQGVFGWVNAEYAVQIDEE